MTLLRSEVSDQRLWNETAARFAGAHVLQSGECGEFKARYGWKPRRFLWRDAGGMQVGAAQILERQSRRLTGLCMLYCPRGPLLDWADESLREAILLDLAELSGFCSGMAGVAFMSYLMRICDKSQAAVQYALLTATYAAAGNLAKMGSGALVDAFGFASFFALTALLALPGLFCMPAARRWLDEAPAAAR